MSPSKRESLTKMEPKTLKIEELDGKIVIRKKPQISSVFYTTLIMVGTLAWPSIYNGQNKIATIFCIFAIIINILLTVSIYFGKIVVDKNERNVTVYTPFKYSKSFEDIDEIDVFSGRRNVVVFNFNNGKDCTFHLGTKNQAKEVDDLLKKLIPLKEKTEEKEYGKQDLSS